MSNEKHIVIAGATGEIGSALIPALINEGYKIVVLTRNVETAREKIRTADKYVKWDTDDINEWGDCLNRAYGVINCAGENMFKKRYTKSFGRKVVSSRIDSSRALVDAMCEVSQKPQVLINSSSIGYYGITDFDDRYIDENAPAGVDKWGPEAALIDREPFKARELDVRVVSMRIGYVLDSNGGGLPDQVKREEKGRGGATTPLDAWRPWIHIDDLVALYLFALKHKEVTDALNATAPNPVTSEQFANALSMSVNGKPNSRKFPGFLLRLLMGPAADVITHGKRIVPKKAQELGFEFTYPTIEDALQDLVPQIRQETSAISS